ncbi:MAG: hypothetical protein ACM36C_02505, partial [Acidobacteriota bacterium]
DGTATERAIDECTFRASQVAVAGEPCYVGLCCTHYGFVSERICRALTGKAGRPILPLDPNERMVRGVLDAAPGAPQGTVAVEVISKVAIGDSSREAMAALLEPASPETAVALRRYTRVRDLF